MPLASAARLALLASALLAVLGAFAGISSGSSTQPLRATAPKLIAHDTSSFFPVVKRTRVRALPGRHAPAAPKKKAAKRGARTLFGGTTANLLQNFAAPGILTGNAPGGAWTTGDIGRTQYLEAVNGNLAIYSRVGGYMSSVSDQAFWSGIGGSDAAGACATAPSGQPAIAYDRSADRWLVAEAAQAGSTWVECYALSTSGNAAGTWNRYVFSISSSVVPDMPSLGVWPDGYYLAVNQSSGTNWKGAGAIVVDRQSMLAHPGSEPTARYFNLSNVSPSLGGMRVATQETASGPASGTPELYAQVYDDPLDVNDRVELWKFHVDWSAPASLSTFTRGWSFGAPSVPAFSADLADVAFNDSGATPPLNYMLPQLGGQLEYFNNGAGTETLTFADTVDGGTGTTKAGWYQLTDSGSGWAVSDKGPYTALGVGGPPAVAFDGSSVALGFDSTLGTTGLTYGDASDTSVTTRNVATTGSTRSLALTLDPLGACTFWLSGPSVAAFSFSSCSPQPSAPVLTADPTWSPGLVQEGTATATASAATFSGATTTVDQWLLCDLNGLNCVNIAGANGTTYIPIAAQADGSHTLRFSETAANAVGSSTAISSPAAIIESLPPVNTKLPAVSGTAETGATLSVDNGTWTSSSSPQFTYRWQRCTGGACSNIDGATSSTYAPTTADVGSTVDVVVTATNTGGGADAASAQTAAIVAAPPGSTGSTTTTTTTTSTTGGTTTTSTTSGTTVESPPDLALTVTASAASAPVGQNVTLYYTVTDKNKQPARSLKVTLTLPSGLAYAGNYAERGPGCVATSASTVVCSLDYVSALTPVTRVQVYLTVKDTSAQTVSATASSTEKDSSASDNTVSIAVGTGANPTSPAVGSTAPPPILGPDGMPVGLNGTSGKSAVGFDTHAPKVSALASSGNRGASAALRFRISDDSGVASAAATIQRNGQAIGSVRTGFGPVAAGIVYFVAWHVPAKVTKGNYTFCVVASDRSKHTGKQSCAPLTVR